MSSASLPVQRTSAGPLDSQNAIPNFICGTVCAIASCRSSTVLMKCDWPRMKLVSAGLSMRTVISSIRYLLRFTEDERIGAQYRKRLAGAGSAAGALTVAAAPASADTARNRRPVASADRNATEPFTHQVPAEAYIPASTLPARVRD